MIMDISGLYLTFNEWVNLLTPFFTCIIFLKGFVILQLLELSIESFNSFKDEFSDLSFLFFFCNDFTFLLILLISCFTLYFSNSVKALSHAISCDIFPASFSISLSSDNIFQIHIEMVKYFLEICEFPYQFVAIEVIIE